MTPSKKEERRSASVLHLPMHLDISHLHSTLPTALFLRWGGCRECAAAVLYVQVELHVMLTGEKLHRLALVALVDVDVAEVYRDGLEGEVYLPGH